MGRPVVVTNVSFYERFTRVNSMRSKAMQCGVQVQNLHLLPQYTLNNDASFSNSFIASPTSQLILQPFRHFTCVTAHSTTIPLFHQNHSSFSNPSVTSPTSQLIIQPFCSFTYVTAHSSTLSSLHLRHSSFSNHTVTSPTSQSILQSFRRFIYVTAHSQTLPSLHPRHSSFNNPSVATPTSFSNPSVTLPTSQLILQPFRCFTYVAAHSPTLLSLLLCHKLFT